MPPRRRQVCGVVMCMPVQVLTQNCVVVCVGVGEVSRRWWFCHVLISGMFFAMLRGGGRECLSIPATGGPEDGGVWTAKTAKQPPQQPAQPPIRQLLGAADAQTAHPVTSSPAPAHQPLGSANAEPTPAGAPTAAADRKQGPDATCEGKDGGLSRAP